MIILSSSLSKENSFPCDFKHEQFLFSLKPILLYYLIVSCTLLSIRCTFLGDDIEYFYNRLINYIYTIFFLITRMWRGYTVHTVLFAKLQVIQQYLLLRLCLQFGFTCLQLFVFISFIILLSLLGKTLFGCTYKCPANVRSKIVKWLLLAVVSVMTRFIAAIMCSCVSVPLHWPTFAPSLSLSPFSFHMTRIATFSYFDWKAGDFSTESDFLQKVYIAVCCIFSTNVCLCPL